MSSFRQVVVVVAVLASVGCSTDQEALPPSTTGTGGTTTIAGECPAQCPAGPEGTQGPAGPTGPAGATGPQGEQGPVGPTGNAGNIGPMGPAGPMGSQGVQGLPGPQGPAGQMGVPGQKGDTGAQGVAGPVGSKGDKGDVGPAGAQGVQGQAGPAGAQGPAGPAGAVSKAKLYVVENAVMLTAGQSGPIEAQCANTTDALVTGGCNAETAIGAPVLVRSYPQWPADMTQKSTWVCRFQVGASSSWIRAYAVCAIP